MTSKPKTEDPWRRAIDPAVPVRDRPQPKDAERQQPEQPAGTPPAKEPPKEPAKR